MIPKGDRMLLEFNIPSRGIIGLRNYLLTVTAGEAIMSHRFIEFQKLLTKFVQLYKGILYVEYTVSVGIERYIGC